MDDVFLRNFSEIVLLWLLAEDVMYFIRHVAGVRVVVVVIIGDEAGSLLTIVGEVGGENCPRYHFEGELYDKLKMKLYVIV